MKLPNKIPEQIIQLPKLPFAAIKAIICGHCNYVNKSGNSFCTNCGYPLHDDFINAHNQKIKERNIILIKAENSVLVARVVLYLMAICMMLGTFIIFSEADMKYFLAIVAFAMACLFFFLALWSRRKPFDALLTSFSMLITFFVINIFDKIIQSFTTTQSLMGLVFSLVLLYIIMRGMQGAYRIKLLRHTTQSKV